MPSETFCVKLFCDYPSFPPRCILKGCYTEKEMETEECLQETNRSELVGILKSCEGEWLGSMGKSTTWNIPSSKSSKLLKKIQAFNRRKELKHIIHLELY